MSNFNENRGVTLIETLLYSMIIFILVGSVLTIVLYMTSSSEQVIARDEVTHNTAFLSQKVAWAIRGADSINIPLVFTSSVSLSTTSSVSAENPLLFTLDNGTVNLKSGAGALDPITNSFVNVTSLSFTTFDYSGEGIYTVRLQAILESTYIGSRASSSIDTFFNIQ